MVRHEPNGLLEAGHRFRQVLLRHEHATQIVMGVSIIRLVNQGLPNSRGGLGQLALLLQYAAQVIVGIDMIRHEPQHLVIICGGLIEPAQFLQHHPEIEERTDIGWPKAHRLLQAGRRFREFSLQMEGVAQVVVRLRTFRPQMDGLPKACHAIIRFADRMQRDPENSMRLDKIGPGPRDRPQSLDGLFISARPVIDHAKQILRIDMAWLLLQDLQAQLLCLSQVARLIVLRGEFSRLGCVDPHVRVIAPLTRHRGRNEESILGRWRLNAEVPFFLAEMPGAIGTIGN